MVWPTASLTGLLFLLCLLVGAAGWGRLCLGLLRAVFGRGNGAFPGGALERWYLAPIVGLGLMSLFTLFAGLAGLLYPALAWGLALAGAAGLLWRWPAVGDVPGVEAHVARSVVDKALPVALIVLAAGSLVYMLFVHALVPPHEWDEISYHMALSKIYVRSHRIVYVPYIVHSNWPMNTEMVFALGLLMGSEMTAHLLTWWMTAWSAWGLYLIGRRFLSRGVGLLAAALYLTVPLVKRLSGTGLIDVSLVFYATAAVLSYASYCRARGAAWAGLAGLLCGFSAGSKLMGAGIALIVGMLIALDALHMPRLSIRRVSGSLALFGAIGLLMVAPWYARSYAFTGNPLWPFLYGVFGGRNWDWLGDAYHMESLTGIWTAELPVSLRGVLLSFWYLFTRPEALGGYSGGLGQVLLVLAALGVVFAFRGPRLIRELALGVAIYYAAWFFLVSHQVRFLFPILPALVLIGAFAFYDVRRWVPWVPVQWATAIALLFFLGSDFPWIQAPERALFASRLPYATGQRSAHAFLEQQIDVLPAMEYANAQLPKDAVVLLLPYETRGYYLDRSYVWGHPISQRIIKFETYDDPVALAEHLRELRITHILDNTAWVYTGLQHWEHDRALMLTLEQQCGRELGHWNETSLYELTACAG
jgi:4-amino-4-deoxy-L-arabinose transferase-like glycosyltransferase